MQQQQRLRGLARPRRGFTFVELLVAIALMVILTGSVVFIFIQAQKIFVSVDAKVQVYQYARFAFDRMERDLSNVVRGRDMEFYNDQPLPAAFRGKYNDNEAIPIRGTANNDASSSGDDTYNHSFTIRQPALYDHMGQGDKFRRDSVYFKTIATVGGQTSAALVEYALKDHDRVRPRMVRRLWRVTGLQQGGGLAAPRYEINGDDRANPLEQDLCLYAMDAQFEMFARNNRRADPGTYYTAEQMCTPPRMHGNPVFPSHHNYWRSGNFMVQCYYDAKHDDSAPTGDPGVFKKDEAGLFKTEGNFLFPALKEGDKIYVYGAAQIQPRDYTIRAFVRYRSGAPLVPWKDGDPPSEFRIQFEEAIDPGSSDASVEYGAVWIPAALRCTVRIKDAKSLELRSVSRVFKISS